MTSAPTLSTPTETVRLWSVTTLIKLGLGTSEPLVNWAVGQTATYAVDKQDAWMPLARADRDAAIRVLKDARWTSSGKAKARGTDIHKAAEQLALGQTPEVADGIFPYVEQYSRFLREHRPVFEMAEAPVYNPEVGYAGTLDGIVRMGGKRLVTDIKTTEHAPDSDKMRPPFSEVALQLVAYRRAQHVGLLSEMRYAGGKRYYIFNPDGHHERLPETDGAVCIVVSPYDYMVIPVRTDEVVWRHFRHVMECARWQVIVSRNLFGPPITVPEKEVAA